MGFKTGRQRRTNQKKLKRTKQALADRRHHAEVREKAIEASNKLRGSLGDVRVTRGARYKQSLWQRIKNWFRNVFGRRSSYPKFD